MIWKQLKKIPYILYVMIFYIKEVVVANLRVAHDILTPGFNMKPGVIAIPLDAKKDVEILSLTNLITFTPGTLSLDVSTDRKVLYIHAMYIDDAQKLIKEIKEGLEKKVVEVLK